LPHQKTLEEYNVLTSSHSQMHLYGGQEVRQRLSVSKQAAHKFDVEVKEECHV